jgi:N-dimethylarginine dimethylaminohydrolase
LRQLQFVLQGLGVDLVVTHSPGWYDSIGQGSIGTSHMDMVCLVPDRRLIVLAPHLVSYGFVRWLMERDFRIVEVPLEEYWDLAVNGVTLEPGKVVLNKGSQTVVEALEHAGVEVIQVDFSESQRFAIAGLHCATLELVRDQPGPLLDLG